MSLSFLAAMLLAAPATVSTGIDEYPPEALRQHAEGTVRVALDIDENGRATTCTVTQSSGFAVLDQATCRLLTVRARYAPARVNGQPVKDVLKTSIDWRIPSDAKPR